MQTQSLRSSLRALKQQRIFGMPMDIWFSSPLFLLLLILFACIV